MLIARKIFNPDFLSSFDAGQSNERKLTPSTLIHSSEGRVLSHTLILRLLDPDSGVTTLDPH